MNEQAPSKEQMQQHLTDLLYSLHLQLDVNNSVPERVSPRAGSTFHLREWLNKVRNSLNKFEETFRASNEPEPARPTHELSIHIDRLRSPKYDGDVMELRKWAAAEIEELLRRFQKACADVTALRVKVLDLEERTAQPPAALALLADDAYAATFQSMAQYRSALLSSLRAAQPPGAIPSPQGECPIGDYERAGVVAPKGNASESPAPPWRPIETAPKDTEIWCYWQPVAKSGRPAMGTAVRSFGMWHRPGSTIEELRVPSHWMPLPSPPTKGESQ